MTLAELKANSVAVTKSDPAEDGTATTDGVIELEEDFWEALVLLNECHDTLTSMLKLNRHQHFMTVHRRTDIESLLAKVSSITDQYELGI